VRDQRVIADDAPVVVAVEDEAAGARTVRIVGDLCYSTVEDLPTAADLVGEQANLVLDLTRVGFVDLAGWRWLDGLVPTGPSAPAAVELRPSPALLRLIEFVLRAVPPSAEDETPWLKTCAGLRGVLPAP
jgi:STAS domain-containing protein